MKAFYFSKRVDHLGHARPLLRGQGAVLVDDPALVGIQVVSGGGFNAAGYFCVSNNIIYRCVKIIRNLHEGGNIRLNLVVFIVVDGLLAHAEGICQFLLTDAAFFSQQFQIQQHESHPPSHIY